MINVSASSKGLYQIHITGTEFRTIDRLLPLAQSIQYIAAMAQAYNLRIAPMSKDMYADMTIKLSTARFATCYR